MASPGTCLHPDLIILTMACLLDLSLPAISVLLCLAVTSPDLLPGFILPAELVSCCLEIADHCLSPGPASIFFSGVKLFLYPVLRTVTTCSTHLISGHHQPATLALMPLHALTFSVSTFRSFRQGSKRGLHNVLCQERDTTVVHC